MDGHRVARARGRAAGRGRPHLRDRRDRLRPARGARAPEGRRPDRERRPPRARGRDRRARPGRGGAARRHRARPRRRPPRLRARGGPPDERRRRRRPSGRDHGPLVLGAGTRGAPARARRPRAGAALLPGRARPRDRHGRSWRRSASSSASRPRSSASSKPAGPSRRTPQRDVSGPGPDMSAAATAEPGRRHAQVAEAGDLRDDALRRLEVGEVTAAREHRESARPEWRSRLARRAPPG